MVPPAPPAPWCPLFKWGQRGRTVYLTIFVPCLKGDDDFTLNLTDTTLTFTAHRKARFAGGMEAERSYLLSLLLHAPVEPARCAHFVRHDHVRVELAKRELCHWRTLQAAGVPRNPNERPDFDHYDGDSDSSAEEQRSPARPARMTPAPTPSAVHQHASRHTAGTSWLPEPSEAVLPLLVLMYAVACPYTKVEESFNMQAVHDMLYLGTELERYDHLEFPGVVPRTFAGALALAAAAAPVALPLGAAGVLLKAHAQLLVRAVLGLASASASLALHRAVRARFGHTSGRAFLLLSAVQFHPLFYGSRTLPNTYGAIAAALATAAWLRSDEQRAVAILTAATVIFRADLLLLLAPLALLALLRRRIGLLALVRTGAAIGVLALAITVPLDSLLWRRPLWPEGEVFFANTVGNMSANYGASPWHWYFTSALPRALALGYPLAIGAITLAPTAREFVLVPLAAIALYSLLPHKELRFVLYAVPPLNVAAAAALAELSTRVPRAPRTTRRRAVAATAWLMLALALGTSAGLALISLAAARLNYPGAHALLALHAATSARPPPRVHIGVEAAMTGVTRFLEMPPPWRYSKREGLATTDLRGFSHLLTGASATDVPGFEVIHEQAGFARVSLTPPFLHTEPMVRVFRRQREPVARRVGEPVGDGGDFFL